MKNNPFFSIVLPTYNRAHRIDVAIISVLGQTYSDLELIIVDDGSVDNTKEVVNSFSDERIVYVYQENMERSAARNNGISIAKGEFICFLDSDDMYLPNHLSVLTDAINEKVEKVALFATGMMRQKSDGIVIGHPIDYKGKIHPVHFIWKYFLLMNSICVHRDIFKHHLFDERFYIWEDTHLWLRIAAQFPVYQIPEYTTLQLVHESSSVESFFNKLDLNNVRQYVQAIDDLFENYSEIIDPFLNQKDKENYIASKYCMFHDVAIRNKQFKVAFKLILMRYKRSRDLIRLTYRLYKFLLAYIFSLVRLILSFKVVIGKSVKNYMVKI